MRLAIWPRLTPRKNSTHEEPFRRQLDEKAERIGIDQIWLYEHHLNPTAPVPSPNLLIAAAGPRTRLSGSRAWSHPAVPEPAASGRRSRALTGARLDMGIGRPDGLAMIFNWVQCPMTWSSAR
jgi:alkanesulfonate monooxygenase SsuD/methylene tetrahydromethanopterin reductase-like flavin-dependent oxidoreductase (luciferase family)